MILWCTMLSAGVGAAFAAIPNLIVVAVDAVVTALSVLLIPGRVGSPTPHPRPATIEA